jgi:hypothetical protein
LGVLAVHCGTCSRPSAPESACRLTVVHACLLLMYTIACVKQSVVCAMPLPAATLPCCRRVPRSVCWRFPGVLRIHWCAQLEPLHSPIIHGCIFACTCLGIQHSVFAPLLPSDSATTRSFSRCDTVGAADADQLHVGGGMNQNEWRWTERPNPASSAVRPWFNHLLVSMPCLACLHTCSNTACRL